MNTFSLSEIYFTEQFIVKKFNLLNEIPILNELFTVLHTDRRLLALMGEQELSPAMIDKRVCEIVVDWHKGRKTELYNASNSVTALFDVFMSTAKLMISQPQRFYTPIFITYWINIYALVVICCSAPVYCTFQITMDHVKLAHYFMRQLAAAVLCSLESTSLFKTINRLACVFTKPASTRDEINTCIVTSYSF